MHRSIPRQGSAHDADHGKGERTPEVGTPFDPRRGSRLMRGHRVWAAKAIEAGESNSTDPRQGSACLCAEDGRGRSGREMRDEVKHDLAVAPATPAATRKTAHGAFPGARCRTSSASGVMQAWDFLVPRGSAARSCSPKSQLRDGTRRMSHTNAQGESHVKSHVKASSGESTQGLANALGRFGIAFAALVPSLACAGIGASPASADACPNEAIRAAQKSSFLPDGSIHLPDCMALEMVSTPKKENQYATIPEVSADGERSRYASGGALGDTPNFLSAFFNRYVASRGDSGWATVAATPVDSEMGLGNGSIFSPDFSSWFHFASTSPQASLGIGRIYRSGIDHRFEPLSPLLVAIDGGTHFRENLTGATLGGASADHSHFYFQPGGNGGDFRMAYLPGDPEPTGPDAISNSYVALLDSSGEPSLELLARDAEGKAWGGNCGAYLGATGQLSERNQGAVSADGSRTYITARPSQPASGPCNGAAHKLRILKRLETSDGPWITPITTSECDRVAPACDTIDGDDIYQGASVDGTKLYFTTNRQLADSDLDTGTGCGFDPSQGCDLYLYDSTRPAGQRLTQVSAGDSSAPTPGGGAAGGRQIPAISTDAAPAPSAPARPAGQRLTQVSAGDSSAPTPGDGAAVGGQIPAISTDGSHVYFIAEGGLTPAQNPEGDQAQAGQRNLYHHQRDEAHPDGRTAFIGTVSSGDQLVGPTFRERAYPVPATARDASGNEIGADGHILHFQTEASLTADDTDGGFLDVYRYDADTEELERVSRAAPGGQDNGALDVVDRFEPVIGLVRPNEFSGPDYAEMGRWASEDGETVVFKTEEGLVPEDQNGFMDSYLLRGGQLYRLPGTSDQFDPAVSAAALDDRPFLPHDGSAVAFTPRRLLLPSDGASAIEVYALRVEGGYPIEPDPKICLGEECQGPAGSPPGGANTASANSPSSGNVKPKPNKCPKGKRKARRAGKVRCVPKKASKAKKANKRNKRAGREQGGQK